MSRVVTRRGQGADGGDEKKVEGRWQDAGALDSGRMCERGLKSEPKTKIGDDLYTCNNHQQTIRKGISSGNWKAGKNASPRKNVGLRKRRMV